jgi:hypothetical protein
MPIFLLMMAIQVACVADVVRHGRNRIWIMALVFLPLASTIAYVIVEVMPRMKHNRHVRVAHAQIVDKLDPEREIRAARNRLDIAETPANQVRLADALVERGRHAEALPLYREAIGNGKLDYRSGEKLARCQYFADQNDAALATLDMMTPPRAASDMDRISLLRARILEDLGRGPEAEAIYVELVDRYPGDEVRCRLAGLFLAAGRTSDARLQLVEVERRLKHMPRHQRAADAPMYDWAMAKLAELAPSRARTR